MFSVNNVNQKSILENQSISFDHFLLKTDDDIFDLKTGTFTANQDGYYTFSFVGAFINGGKIEVQVDKKTKLNFLSKRADGGGDSESITFIFQLKLNKGQKVQLFLAKAAYKKEGIECVTDGNCVFNGRFVRPL